MPLVRFLNTTLEEAGAEAESGLTDCIVLGNFEYSTVKGKGGIAAGRYDPMAHGI